MGDLRERGIYSRVLYRIKLLLNKVNNSWDTYVQFKMSRDKANRTREKVVSNKQKEVVDKTQIKIIKEYCRDTFGSNAYWPWLALYTELRGRFKEGWIPDDFYRYEILPKMNPRSYVQFSNTKSIYHLLFNESIIEPLFIRLNGHYYDKAHSLQTKDEVRNILYELDHEIIIKPDIGRGGKQITLKNSKELTLKELSTNGNLILQKVVEQHHTLNKLYPHSVNTFRVLTFIDERGVVEVKFIIIRFGQDGARVDNLSRGGGWIFVHQDGNVEPNAYNGYGNVLGTKHPDTKTVYANLEIPFVDKVVDLCKKAHRSYPYTRIVAWDVFVDKKGKPKLIEWNANYPGISVVEALFGPFFSELIER